MANLIRRKLMKQCAFIFASLPLFAVRRTLASGKEKKDALVPAGTHPVSESDAVANALGYRPNAKDVDATRFPQRKNSAAKNQCCKVCANFTAVNEDWGKCLVITGGLVSSEGWCESWTKKVAK
jgi:hypothetical protein